VPGRRNCSDAIRVSGAHQIAQTHASRSGPSWNGNGRQEWRSDSWRFEIAILNGRVVGR